MILWSVISDVIFSPFNMNSYYGNKIWSIKQNELSIIYIFKMTLTKNERRRLLATHLILRRKAPGIPLRRTEELIFKGNKAGFKNHHWVTLILSLSVSTTLQSLLSTSEITTDLLVQRTLRYPKLRTSQIQRKIK